MTYNILPGNAHVMRPPDVTVPLAVPQRRVAHRLRGRDRLLARLTSALTDRAAGDPDVPGVWLLSGMGGCGKTSVSLEVAHRLASASTQVWWVSGVDGEVLSSALRSVAFASGAQPADFAMAHPADVLWKHLNGLTAPWLLVLDNIDDPAVLAAAPSRAAAGIGWLRPPEHHWGTVLITSRETRLERWGHWVNMIGVDLLPTADGADVLLDLAPGAGKVQDARKLADDLAGLPLALDLAGSYLARSLEATWLSPSTPVTFTAYRHALDSRLADVTSDPDPDLGADERARRTLLSTWELSLDLLHRQGADLARALLRLLCAFGPAPIPYQELLDLGALARSELFANPAQDRLDTTLKGLEGLRLITVERPDVAVQSDEGPSRWITIHPLVRAASRAHPEFTAQAPLMLELVTDLLHRSTSRLETDNPAHSPLWRALAPHCAAARVLLADYEGGVATDAGLVTTVTEPAVRAAQFYAYAGLYGEAVAELSPLVDVRARYLGAEYPSTISAQLHLAAALRENGDLIESDELYRDVVRAGDRGLSDQHPYLHSARSGRARTLLDLGRYGAAEAELRASLALRLRDPQADQGGILRARHELARLAHFGGRLEEAVTELRDIHRRTRDLSGESHRDTLGARLSLVRALRDAGYAEEAQDAAEEVVRDSLRVMPPDHPGVLIARHERARIVRDHESDLASLERARDEFTDIWQSGERQFGTDHPDTIAARHELATVWHLLGRPEVAETHFQAAFEAGRRRLGERHPNVAVCARHLAMVRAELAQRTTTGKDSSDSPCAIEPRQGDISMGNSPVAENPLPSGAPDLFDLSFEEALSPEPHNAWSSPSTARLVARFIRPRQCPVGGGDSGGSYSDGHSDSYSGTASQSPSAKGKRRRPTYRPPASDVPPVTKPYGRRLTPDSGDGADLFEHAPGSLLLGDDTLRAIATGQEDSAAIGKLRAQQRTVRALVLGELLRKADALTADHATALPIVGAVRDLLLEAHHTDPTAVATVLLHPAVGRWLSRALRTLSSFPKSSHRQSLAWSADLPHLHSVAAAAAIRAGIDFRVPIPLRDGIAFLPTLGAAQLHPTESATALAISDGEAIVISNKESKVRLAGPTGRFSKGWLPAHRVGAFGTYPQFDFILDDLDPYRMANGPLPPQRLDQSQVEQWRHRVAGARNILTRLDLRQAEALATAVTAITPRRKVPGGRVFSMSSSEAFGGAVISAAPHAADLAVSLIHEYRHMKLNAVLDACDLFQDEGEEAEDTLYYAPWRDDPRPLPGFFHGVFAHFGVVEFWRRLIRTTQDPKLRRRAEFQFVHWRTQTSDAYVALRSSPKLTQTGREFTALMGDSATAWTDHETIPDNVTMLAAEAVTAHRSRWRMHYLRPEDGSVVQLADAWSSHAPRSPRQQVDSTFQRNLPPPSLDGYTATLTQVAADPSHFRNHATGTVDPSDRARLLGDVDRALHLATSQVTRWPHQGDSWVRLSLALQRLHAEPSLDASGTAIAAQALTHRPEVVQAVHAHVTATTGTPPNPVALASWIGVPDGATDLPALPL
ncbi:HEXXH motif-containing putative peptide modification protein [Streptomyces sp. NPDC046821]|uniref:aKG-HExxH-type peptide beta-hydroxylase n=1 Tax=Streptomyces sp. NPDC046821 TaxID=3154702 RepID=UPI003411261D